jgi:hypothetical protein
LSIAGNGSNPDLALSLERGPPRVSGATRFVAGPEQDNGRATEMWPFLFKTILV